MKLRNKQTGEIVDFLTIDLIDSDEMEFTYLQASGHENSWSYNSLEKFNEEWEDYEPKEPIFDEKIRRGIRAWWDMQDNPFKAAAVMCNEKKDLDGFYHWRIFGYIRDGEQRESTDLCFRTKKLYAYEKCHDYTKDELCGEEEL